MNSIFDLKIINDENDRIRKTPAYVLYFSQRALLEAKNYLKDFVNKKS